MCEVKLSPRECLHVWVEHTNPERGYIYDVCRGCGTIRDNPMHGDRDRAYALGRRDVIDSVVTPLQSRIEQLAHALLNAPAASAYHGMRGFDTERFLADYEAWRITVRAILGSAGSEASR